MDIRAHLENDVLAWWMSHGPDAGGGVRTCWDNRGERLVSDRKYTWSQGRWAWLTARVAAAARAGVLTLDPEPFERTCLATAAFVADHALLPDGSTAFLTTRGGTPIALDGALHTSVFADLFVALGFAGAAGLEPSGPWLDRGVRLLTSAARRYRVDDYLCEPYPVPPGRGTHAMPMMLLGAGENLVRAGAGEAALGVVRLAMDELDRLHWGPDGAAELPWRDGTPDTTTLLGRHRCPGHLLEALWFVVHAADLVPGHPVTDPGRLTDLALAACEAGWDPRHGGLLRYVDVDGGAPRGSTSGGGYEDLVIRTWDTKLWWPHAEALYALALLAHRTGDPRLAEWRDRIGRYTFATFPQGPGREWIQNRNADGSPLDEVVALPVKDPMHVARSLLLLTRLHHDAERQKGAA